ncbi:unnamed protein product [Parnassius apollo]|uniref:(apollo) hypothetical protein n=1 Tax=Parnassius apollo TaxID=110799 RepID=A0A8S3XZ12_PARAO|nr:unnamed protein product [Parnassius apollo]
MACEIHTGVNDVFTKKQIHHILKRSLGFTSFELIACDKRPAVIGMAGFLGDHFRVTLHVKVNGYVEKIKLFVKSVPVCNAPKADFINKGGFYKREMVAFQLSEEMHGAEGPNPWCAKAYLCNETILVMPDLAVEGYRTFMNHEVLDLKHTLLTTASIARFHASFANYVTRRMLHDKSFDLTNWCERSRMFAIFGAIGILPFVLMDPKTAQKTFDDPDTFVKYCDEDRTEPVLAYCRESKVYMERLLEVNEEFVERYVLKQL